MTGTEARRASAASRRAGYVVAVLVNAAILYVVNVWPGWQALPILTDQTTQVLVVLNGSMIASMALNAVYVVYDGRWLKSFGDLVMTVWAFAVLVRVWQVFPFDIDDSSINWMLIIRVALGFMIFATAIAIVVQLVQLVARVIRAGTEGPG